jgi:hypothetical protein
MFFAGAAKVSHQSCNGVSPELQQRLTGAAMTSCRSCNDISPELQRCLARAVKLSRGSYKAVQQELQWCLAGATNKMQRSTIGAASAIGDCYSVMAPEKTGGV